MGIWKHKIDEYCLIMLRKDNVQDIHQMERIVSFENEDNIILWCY